MLPSLLVWEFHWHCVLGPIAWVNYKVRPELGQMWALTISYCLFLVHWLQWRNPTNRGSSVDWQLQKPFPLQKQQATGFTDYLSYLNVMSFKKGSLSCILFCFHSLFHLVLWILHFLTQGLHILYPYLGTTSHRKRFFCRGAKELSPDLSHFLHSFQTLSSGTVAYSMS